MSRFDTLSFWIGVIVSSAIWGIALALRPAIKQIMEKLQEQQVEAKQRADTTFEDTYRKLVYKRTQEMHLTASLFSLDEVVEAPRLLAPPVQVTPDKPLQHENAAGQSIPYMPAWPELASVYHAPSLSIPEALSGGMNIAIIGQPGTGKTVALAYLAAQVANRTPEAESLNEHIPFILHVADLGLPVGEPKKPEDLLQPIRENITDFTPMFARGKVTPFVNAIFQGGRALLLVDGVDELPQADVQVVASYLRMILRAFPKTRMVITGAPEYLDGLTAIGFAPLAIMPWNTNQQKQFLVKWTGLWKQYVALESWAQSATPVDTTLLNRWLSTDNIGLTPLEYTLKIWAAYAGDTLGPRPADAIEAHIRRLTPVDVPQDALLMLGMQSMVNAQSIFDQSRAKEWVKSFEVVEAPEAAPAVETATETEASEGAEIAESGKKKDKGAKKPAAQVQPVRASLLQKLADSGLLSSHRNSSNMRFAHPLMGSFLAGKGLKAYNTPEAMLKQPAWSGQVQTLRYIAAFGDGTAIAQHLVGQVDHMLYRPQLTAARLLRDAPRNAAWRGTVMGTLLTMLQHEDTPASLRAQVVAAFAFSGDASASTLFRQLLGAPSMELRWMGALGAGAMQDSKAVDGLVAVMSQTTGPARMASCLALVEIGTHPALEALAVGLLRGDEELRIAAAEALANHPTDGYETLREGITSQDILLRRAVVYGLARVREPWAIQLLEKVQTEDEQWVVRNAAVELMDALQNPDTHIPHRPTPPAETPWLIEFAGQYGMGITPGQPATDILLLALKEKKPELRSAALDYLRYSSTEGVIGALYQSFYSGDPDLRDDVYQTLWNIGLSGAPMPAPMQFGLG